MRANRWGLLLAVSILAASCSAAEQTNTVAPPPASATAAPTIGTQPPITVGTSSSTSTTAVDTTPTARPIQLAAEPGACTLVPGRTDFADFPRERVVEARGSMPSSLPDVEDTFPGEPGFATPLSAYNVGGEAPWFALANVGLARFDADQVVVDRVLLTTPSCQIHQVDADGDRIAVRACAESIYAEDPGACTLVVVDPAGTVTGRWAIEGTTGPGRMTWADGRVVMVGFAGPPLLALVVDPATGAGSVVDSLAGCTGTSYPSALVPTTTLVSAICDGTSRSQQLIDVETGVVLGPGPGRDENLVPVDAPVRPRSSVLVDPVTATFAAATPMHPAVIAAVDADPTGTVTSVVETPQGAWVQRCLERCDPYARSSMELSFVDLDGHVVARWPVSSSVPSRGGSPPSAARGPMVDETGAWVPVDGRVVRLTPVG